MAEKRIEDVVLGPDDPPTEVTRRADGSLREEKWISDDDRYHFDRLGGPSYVTYRLDGQVESYAWYRRGVFHREGGPAEFTSDARGRATEVFYVEGREHRIDGPAVIRYSAAGVVAWEHFFLFGEQRTAEEVATYRTAVEAGSPVEWALAYALGEVG